jgi:hypothetical protein
LHGVDFGASSFVHCEFSGKLQSVWFRGGFPLESDIQHFGVPRKNVMASVSFEKASLWGMTFSDHCDLSTIVMPSEGSYRLYNEWHNRLERLKQEIDNWPHELQREAHIFADVYLVHAEDQDWYLLNCDEVIIDEGEELGTRIINALDQYATEN